MSGRGANRAYRGEDSAQGDRRGEKSGDREDPEAVQGSAEEQGLRRAREEEFRRRRIGGERRRPRLLPAWAVAAGGRQNGLRDPGRADDADRGVESRLQLYQGDGASRRINLAAH